MLPSMLTLWVHQARHITALTSMNMTTYPLIHINQGMVVNDLGKLLGMI